MTGLNLKLMSAVLLLACWVMPSFAQSGSPTTAKAVSSATVSFHALEGKWVKYSTAPVTFIEISTRGGKLHAQYVGAQSGQHYDCTNVNYQNGELSFEFPGKPVPVYKLKLTPGGTQLIGELVHPSFPYPIPVVMEKVDTWPTPEEIAARGPAGPAIVRK